MNTSEIIGKYDQEIGGFDANPVRDGLLQDLNEHLSQQRVYQVIQIALIILLTLLGIGALAFDLVLDGDRYLVLAGAGVSIPTLLALLRKTINDISGANLFIILVKNSNEKEARTLLRRFTQR